MAARGFFRARLLQSCFKQNSLYPRLYLVARPQLIPYTQEKLFPEFNAQVAIVGGLGEDRKDSKNGYKNREPTYYHKLSFQYKLYKPSQTLHNIW